MALAFPELPLFHYSRWNSRGHSGCFLPRNCFISVLVYFPSFELFFEVFCLEVELVSVLFGVDSGLLTWSFEWPESFLSCFGSPVLKSKWCLFFGDEFRASLSLRFCVGEGYLEALRLVGCLFWSLLESGLGVIKGPNMVCGRRLYRWLWGQEVVRRWFFLHFGEFGGCDIRPRAPLHLDACACIEWQHASVTSSGPGKCRGERKHYFLHCTSNAKDKQRRQCYVRDIKQLIRGYRTIFPSLPLLSVLILRCIFPNVLPLPFFLGGALFVVSWLLLALLFQPTIFFWRVLRLESFTK